MSCLFIVQLYLGYFILFPVKEAGASQGWGESGESADWAMKKDRRQNCETLSCFINLHVRSIQRQVGQVNQTGISNTLAWIVSWHIICITRSWCKG